MMSRTNTLILIFFMNCINIKIFLFLLFQVGVFRTMQNSANMSFARFSTDRDAPRHVSRDLDFPWHRSAKRFTLVNPSISGYHSGSRSRD